jgi:hypothetical protein
MKNYLKGFVGVAALFLGTALQAQYYSLTPVSGYPGTVSAPIHSSTPILIQYTVKNLMPSSTVVEVRSSANAAPGLPTGISQGTSTTGTACPTLPFTLASGVSCTLALSVMPNALTGNVVGGPFVCQQGTFRCNQPTTGNGFNITRNAGAALQANQSALALKVSGNARYITITNAGAATATSVGFSGDCPGTTCYLSTSTIVSNNSCTSMLAGDVCYLIVIPGSKPTAVPPNGGSATLTVNWMNGGTQASLPLTIYILTYGSQYQDSYVFAIGEDTDTSPVAGNITGTGAALQDLPTVLAWDSSPACWTVGCLLIGTSFNNSPTANGSINTYGTSQMTGIINKLTYYNASPQPIASYAAGACSQSTSTNGYKNWYLPSICEMDDSVGVGTCYSDQSMQKNLNANTYFGSGYYWSSTENDLANAWFQSFTYAFQDVDVKQYGYGVRCVRAFNP